MYLFFIDMMVMELKQRISAGRAVGTDGDREGKLPLDIHAPPAEVRDPGRVRLGGPGSDSQKEKGFLQGRVLHLR